MYVVTIFESLTETSLWCLRAAVGRVVTYICVLVCKIGPYEIFPL